MKTLRKLSNRKLDQLQDRLEARLLSARYQPARRKLRAKLIRLANERLRRIGL